MVNGFLYLIGAFVAIVVDLFLEKRRRIKRLSSLDHSLNELKTAIKELSVVSNQGIFNLEEEKCTVKVELGQQEKDLLRAALKLYTTEWKVFDSFDKKYAKEDMVKMVRQVATKLT